MFGAKRMNGLEVPVTNEHKNLLWSPQCLVSQKFFVKAFDKNSESTLAAYKPYWLESWLSIALIWDGASYHRSGGVKDYLALSQSKSLQESSERITCIQFAPATT